MSLAILTSHPVQYYAPLFRELARRLDVTVYFAHRATPSQQAAAGFGAEFEWDLDLLEGYRHVFLQNVARRPGADHFGGCDTPEIFKRLSALRCGALLVMGWHLKAYWQGVWAAKRLGIPVLVRGDSHLGTPRHWIKRIGKNMTYPVMLRLFDAALYVGRRNRAYYEYYGYPKKRLFFSPHCVDTERFAAGASSSARTELRARLGIAPGDKVALFAGKLLALKRPLDLVDAAALCRANGLEVHVLVAGSGPLETDLRSRAAAGGVPLHVLGFQNQTEMPNVYAASDVLVLPSSRETWGLVANEALACGRPIVVSDAVGCAPDLAADRSVGRTFPVGNIRALAAAISEMLCAPACMRAIRRVAEGCSLYAGAEGVIAAVAEVTNRPPRR